MDDGGQVRVAIVEDVGAGGIEECGAERVDALGSPDDGRLPAAREFRERGQRQFDRLGAAACDRHGKEVQQRALGFVTHLLGDVIPGGVGHEAGEGLADAGSGLHVFSLGHLRSAAMIAKVRPDNFRSGEYRVTIKDSQPNERGLAVVRTVAELRKAVSAFRAAGRTVGLVPTMGALHEGHVSLVKGAIARGDVPAASIFVNPTQFGPNEDFAAYPRDEAGDFAKLEAAGCRIVFAPDKDEMYPVPMLTTVKVTGVTEGLCGPFRPGHFDGVATVVTKLLMMAMPDRGYFGEKDFQQLQVIKTMVRDLAMPFEIVGMPTVREADGLAMSSRNRYLSPAERTTALSLYREMNAVAAAVRGGAASCAAATAAASRALLAAGFDKVEYLTVVDARSLQPLETVSGLARVIVAARLGRTRLIDNIAVG